MSYALPATAALERPVIRTLYAEDLKLALRKGFEDFKAIPTQLVFLCLLYPVIGFAAARMATGDLLPLLFPLVAGLSLMGPLMAVGLYELSRRREAGLAVSWLNAFDVLRSPAIVGIVVLGVVLLLIFGAWLAAARVIYAATIGIPPSGVVDFTAAVLHSGAGMRLIVLGNLVGLGFAVLVLAISAVSFPMMLDRNCSPGVAVQTSLRVVAQNPRVMALWGVVVAAVLAAGCVPLFVGLAVAMPILGHATWHLYRAAVA